MLDPDQALALIDDVVEGKFAAADLATIHGIPQESIRTTLGKITRAVGTGRVRSLAAGGWCERKSDDRPYDVAPGFAAAWRKARGPVMTEHPTPFFVIVADHDQGFFCVEGPMTGPGRMPLAILATSLACTLCAGRPARS